MGGKLMLFIKYMILFEEKQMKIRDVVAEKEITATRTVSLSTVDGVLVDKPIIL